MKAHRRFTSNKPAFGSDRRRTRHVAQDRDLADDLVRPEGRNGYRARGGLDQNLGLAGDDQIGSIRLITLLKQHLAMIEADAFAHERQKFEFCRLDLGKKRHAP